MVFTGSGNDRTEPAGTGDRVSTTQTMPRREVPGDHRHKHGNEQWSAFLDAENRSYYYNSVTGESTYENPYYYSDDEDEDDISQLENEESQKRAKRHVRIQEAQNRQQRVKAANDAARGVGTEVVAYGQTYDTLPSQASWSGSDGGSRCSSYKPTTYV